MQTANEIQEKSGNARGDFARSGFWDRFHNLLSAIARGTDLRGPADFILDFWFPVGISRATAAACTNYQ